MNNLCYLISDDRWPVLLSNCRYHLLLTGVEIFEMIVSYDNFYEEMPVVENVRMLPTICHYRVFQPAANVQYTPDKLGIERRYS